MAIMAAKILAGVSIALLAVYGADVAAVQLLMTPDEVPLRDAPPQLDAGGFLPLDERARGMFLGAPSLILPIIAFFISIKEPSKGLGGLIITAGALIIIGGAVVLALGTPGDTERNVLAEAGPLLGAGAFVLALGTIKIKRS